MYASAASASVPPLFTIKALSLRDAGLQHGTLAGDRIRGWMDSGEMLAVKNFSLGTGNSAFRQMIADNTRVFPEVVSELEGIAEGANLPVESIWAGTLLSEMESLMPHSSRVGHCSDIYAVADGGYAAGFAHGHHVDGPGPVHDYFYYVSYVAEAGADFASCAGLVYPGNTVGWAPTWNAEGMYLTQNSLFPLRTRAGGLGSMFVQRQAICGLSKERRGMDTVVAGLMRGGLSSGASVNLVDLKERRMASVELHEDAASVRAVGPAGVASSVANYSHFNMYKELEVGRADAPNNSTLHRQARVDEMPPPRTLGDVKATLSDAADAEYPIFRGMTLASLALDGSTGSLDVWCCGDAAAAAPPAYRWNVLSFFQDRAG
jgi:hypothetical protein